MAGEMWLKIVFIVMLMIYPVSGDEHTFSLNKSTIPCYIKYDNDGNTREDSNGIEGSYKVFIPTSWMRHQGCYYQLQNITDSRTKIIRYNSPGRCSLLCESYQYFCVQKELCMCLKDQDLFKKNVGSNCQHRCSDLSSKATCGSKNNNWYFDMYEQMIDMHVEGHNNMNKKCMVARKGEFNIILMAVSCSERYDGFLFDSIGETYNHDNFDNITNGEANKLVDGSFSLFGDKWRQNEDKLPNNRFVWTSFNRSNIIILESRKMMFNNTKCQLEIGHNWSNARLIFNTTEYMFLSIDMQCSLRENAMCYIPNDPDILDLKSKTAKDSENHSHTTIPTESKNTYVSLENKTEERSTFITMSTEVESQRLSTYAESTSIYKLNTTHATFLFDNSVFPLQIGIAVSVSCMVIFFATLACCINRPKRSKENIVMAMEGPPQQTKPTAALAENYSDPKDKTSTSSEIEGPRFCATANCQNTNCQKTENGEYQYLDFTLRSETTPRFADNSEYDHVRANVISVSEQPWDTATSKVNKLFSQISKSVVQKGQNLRKSLIKSRVSRSGSPKLKCKASEYCDAWKTQLNNQQFVFDSNVDNQSNISIDVANSTVDSNKDEPEFRRTDIAFPVLPYSERINVKSTHIYDEPDDRRMSLRERLLHMISIRPLKMPFNIELDLRGSRSKSKIYSLATSIDEIDESVA